MWMNRSLFPSPIVMRNWMTLILLAGCLPSVLVALQPGRPLDQYQLQNWQIRDGIPGDTVSGVAQDHDGFLWIGTSEGLVRFDGQRMIVFNRENVPSMKSAATGLPVVDRQGVVWFPTRRGLGRVVKGNVEFWTTAQGLSDDAVRVLRLDRKGVLWVGTHLGVDRIENGKVTPVRGLPKDDVQSLEICADGSLWVGTNTSLIHLQNGSVATFTAKDGLAGTVIYALREDRNGDLWIGSDKGMTLLHNGTFRRIKELPETYQRHVFEDRAGAIWVSTDDGLYRGEKGTWQRLGPEQGLGDKRIRSTFEDREGNLWVGTFAAGMTALKDSRFENYSKSQGLIDDSVWTVFVDSKQRVWAGTNDGVSILSDGRIQSIHLKDGLSNERIGSLAEGPDGAIWIGTAKGLNRWDNGRIRAFSVKDGLPHENILSLFRDHAGVLWAGTVAGLVRWDGKQFSTLTVKDGMPGNLVRSITEDQSGTLWLGTGHGVSAFRDGHFTNYNTSNGLPQSAVMAVHPDRYGSVWVSTVGGGLSRLRNGKVFTFTPAHGVPAQTPYQIVEDPSGALWMSHGRGVYRADRASLDAVAEGRAPSAQIEQYGMAEGMKASGCNGGSQPAAWAAPDGRVWLATSSGIAAIRRGSPDFGPAPRVFLESMSAAGQPVNPVPDLRLAPMNKKVSFRFTAPTIRGQSRLNFQYRLVGQDANWTDAGDRREAFFTNLAPGSYQFEVRARLGDLPWGPTADPVSFELEPWFYQAWWFYALCSIALAGLLWTAHRVRLRVVREKYESVLSERERISRELHDSLMQGFIGAALQVQGAIRMIRTSPETAADRLKRAHTLMNASIREARDAVTDLRTPATGTALREGLERCAREVCDGNAVQVTVSQQGNLDPCPESVRWAILRIGREAIANAIRHGKPTEVQVRILSEGERLRLEIEDNGCGFTLDEARGSSEGHWGLAGMRERASQLSGSLDVESTPGQGTRVVALLPLLPQSLSATSGS